MKTLNQFYYTTPSESRKTHNTPKVQSVLRNKAWQNQMLYSDFQLLLNLSFLRPLLHVDTVSAYTMLPSKSLL